MMGYFSNSTEGDIYEYNVCRHCRHNTGPGEPPCAVWFLHIMHNYDQQSNPNLQHALSTLIPRDDKGRNQQCAMFIPKENAREPRTSTS